MCDFISGYKLPDGSLHFHTDADVEAAWEKENPNSESAIPWQDMVGHSGYRFCFGIPPKGSVEVEGLRLLLSLDLRKFRKLMRAAGYKSIILNSSEQVAKGRKLFAEGDKLFAEGSKLHAKGYKLHAKGYKLFAEGYKLHAKGYELFAEHRKLYAKGRKLFAESDKLHAKGYELCFTITYI